MPQSEELYHFPADEVTSKQQKAVKANFIVPISLK